MDGVSSGWNFLWLPAMVIAGAYLGNKLGPKYRRLREAEKLLELATGAAQVAKTSLEKIEAEELIVKLREYIRNGADSPPKGESDSNEDGILSCIKARLKSLNPLASKN